jgi:hypothetical protein
LWAFPAVRICHSSAMARTLHLYPDAGPYFGVLDGRAVQATDDLPVSSELRVAVQSWWDSAWGEHDPRPDLDDEGYESLTADLVRQLQDELGPDWIVTYSL